MTPETEPAFDHSTVQYLRLVEGLKQAVIGTDGKGNIILWSAEAEALYAWSRDEVMGLNVIEVVPAAISKGEGAEIMATLAEGRIWSGSFVVRSEEKESFEISVTDIPLMNSNQQVAGIIGVSALPDPITRSPR